MSRDRISVLIVDDHTVAREGLRAMLGTDDRVEVVGEAGDGQEALAQVAELRPQVVLMDVRMPGLDGLEATRRLKVAHPSTSVIIMTSYDDEALIVDAVRAGASGYLLKDASRSLLGHTIGAAASGGILVKDALLRRAINSLASAARPTATESPSEPETEELTEREQKVLCLLAEGRTNREIGDALGLAEVTVKKHVQAIIAKLRAASRTNAAVVGLRMGIIN